MPRTARAALLLSSLWVLAACSFLPQPAQNSTRSQLPNLSGYRQTEGEALTGQLTANQILDTLLSAQPQLAVVAEIIIQAGSCAQEHGVVNWRTYVREDDPAAAGVVVVASQNQATDPQVLLTCGIDIISQRSLGPAELSPCTNNFSYTAGGDTFYVFYAASKQSVCADFQQALPSSQ